jgi:hypothetical protein
MRRRTFARDLFGTVLVFVILAIVIFLIVIGEHFLDNFKSH